MIALLKGNVAAIQNDSLIVDVNGVGYLVFVPLSVRDEATLEEPATFYITTVVREDAITLYGFSTTNQREAFETLRSVNKVGPKLALTILGHLDLPLLASAVERNDIITLSKMRRQLNNITLVIKRQIRNVTVELIVAI